VTQKPYTVAERADKVMRCCACRGALRAGEDAVVRVVDGYVEHAHITCPAPPPLPGPDRVIQGAQ
jgi:hypothetical protein